MRPELSRASLRSSVSLHAPQTLAITGLGDGVRCIGGHLARLRLRNSVNGVIRFPDDTDSVTLSVRGDVAVCSGVTRYYQVFYRTAAATSCSSGASNLTNARAVTW